MTAVVGVTVGYADTNLFYSLLAGPSHPFHERSLDIFRRVAEGQLSLIVMPVIVAELVYTTTGALKWSRAQASTRLASMLESDGLTVRELSVVLDALRLYGQHRRLDFADAYLAASASRAGPAVVVSFDRDFDGIEGVTRTAA